MTYFRSEVKSYEPEKRYNQKVRGMSKKGVFGSPLGVKMLLLPWLPKPRVIVSRGHHTSTNAETTPGRWKALK